MIRAGGLPCLRPLCEPAVGADPLSVDPLSLRSRQKCRHLGDIPRRSDPVQRRQLRDPPVTTPTFSDTSSIVFLHHRVCSAVIRLCSAPLL